MKVIVDTNVLLSGAIWGGMPGRVLHAWKIGEFTLVVSADILEEYWRVGARMAKHSSKVKLPDFLEQVEATAERVEPARGLDLHCDDPDDIKFLEAAAATRAKYLVSGDKALLRVGKYPYGKVVTPREFLATLG